MIAGARVEIAPFKEDAMDFVLWKPSDADLPGWDSPWGRGRPGWHIECSAMSHELLGAAFDIHGGGLDLQFPHHENEIAQSHCAHPEAGFAKIWMHNEMLQVEGKKMSKSLGNFFTVRDLLDKGVPGEVMRMVFLGTHYRKPMDWRADKSRDAERALRRWRKLTEGVEPSNPAPEVVNFLCDDLNTAGAIDFLGHLGQVLFQRSKEANEDPVSTTRSEKRDELAKEFLASAQLLGLLLEGDGQWTETPDLNPIAYKLSELRNSAALTKDFSAVDALKAALVAAGVDVRMSKTGVELVPGPGFDLMKLKGLG
jgi:cysteinyl-tRNA synthetase